MTALPAPLQLTVPSSYEPYVQYTRSLDSFNRHTQDLESVFAYIARQNKDAKDAGLHGDEAVAKMTEVLQQYFVALKDDKDEQGIFENFFTEYHMHPNGVKYFGFWLEGYAKKAMKFIAAEKELEITSS